MSAYYNEFDPFAASWLRELIKAGLIADGEVDERSITDVAADDVRGFTQCHFFAGIGGWSLALRLAGWPDDGPKVWTGSCPCQPFSAAGAQAGGHDPRDLWPAWYQLVAECRPPVVFGEQVEAAIGHGWLDRLCDDLEREDYAVGAVCLPGPCVGAFDIRQRLWFVGERLDIANSARSESERIRTKGEAWDEARLRGSECGCSTGSMAESSGAERGSRRSGRSGATGSGSRAEQLDDATSARRVESNRQDRTDYRQAKKFRGSSDAGDTDLTGSQGRELSTERAGERLIGASGVADRLADDDGERRDRGAASRVHERRAGPGGDDAEARGTDGTLGNDVVGRGGSGDESGRIDTLAARSTPAPGASFWSDADWIPCTDGKARPVEPGTQPLAHGVSNRVGRLRGYGNAIKPQVAAAFIQAYLDARGEP